MVELLLSQMKKEMSLVGLIMNTSTATMTVESVNDMLRRDKSDKTRERLLTLPLSTALLIQDWQSF